MKRKKKRILGIAGVVLLLVILFIGGSVLQNIGTLDTEKARIAKFSTLPYYSSQHDVFVSPEELEFYPERTTGGNAGFGRFFYEIPSFSYGRIAESRFEKDRFFNRTIGLCPLLAGTFICYFGIRRCSGID